ncbi:MAG TPA: sugar nucleotide-binding protein, partial [Pyrinomonadaceae bacterium]|nr:sugar nucleotide-binding protein [Pyrinomonadaceae bacterium]
IARALRSEKLLAITDARGTPTYGDDLAARLRELALLNTTGIFHVVNSGSGASYEEFVRHALEIAGQNEAKIQPVTEASLHRPAPRPANSCLRCLRSQSLGLTDLPHWQDALRIFVAREVELSSLAGSVAPAQT